MRRGYVYTLHARGGPPRYVGCTTDPERRLREHRAGLTPTTAAWVAEVGSASVELTVVVERPSFADALRHERRTIWKLHRADAPLLNRVYFPKPELAHLTDDQLRTRAEAHLRLIEGSRERFPSLERGLRRFQDELRRRVRARRLSS